MQYRKHTQLNKTKYCNINSEERKEIIKYFTENQLTASQISQLTNHNLSTVKAIYRVFKKEGRINKKEKRDRFLNVVKNVAIVFVDDTSKEIQLVEKRQIKKQIILKNCEHFNDLIDVKQYDTVLDLLKKSFSKMEQYFDQIKSQQKYNEIVKYLLDNGIKDNDFKQLPTQPILRANIQWKKIQKIFEDDQENHCSIEKEFFSFQTNEKGIEIHNLDALKLAFENQIQYIRSQTEQ